MAADRSNPGVKKMFEELAKEEDGHRKKLQKFDPKTMGGMEIKETRGMGLSELMEDIAFSSEMSYADLIRFAIKNEERSQKLYATTAQGVKDASLKKLLLILAQEESTHKERLEKIYDKEILQEF
jgi:rubrerythrin